MYWHLLMFKVIFSYLKIPNSGTTLALLHHLEYEKRETLLNCVIDNGPLGFVVSHRKS